MHATGGTYPSPISDPYADPTTEPFWAAALEGRLVASHCTHCGVFQLPPPARCFNCGNRTYEWVDLPGTGTVYTFTVIRHPLRADLQDIVPYICAVVELDGADGSGARIAANVVGCGIDDIQIGTRVTVMFDRQSDTLVIPRFTPIKQS